MSENNICSERAASAEGNSSQAEYPSKERQIALYFTCTISGIILIWVLLMRRGIQPSKQPIQAVSLSISTTSKAGSQITHTVDQLEDLLSRSSGTFGRVDKLSLVQKKFWSSSGQAPAARNYSIQQWVSQHDVALGPIDGPVQPFGCSIWINHKYRLIYVRLAHSSSTSIMNFFGNCALHDTPWCFEELSRTSLAETEIEKHLREYTVFTFVRNPWQRAASAYSYLNYVFRTQRAARKGTKVEDSFLKKNPHCHFDWALYCKNPRALARQCREFPHCCSSPNIDAIYWHTEPQYGCLVGSDGRWAVDFIGRSEKNEADMWDLLKLINERRSYAVPPVNETDTMEHRNVQKCDPTATSKIKVAKEADLAACDPVEKYVKYYVSSPDCFQGVSNFYADDVVQLGFVDEGWVDV